MRLRSSVTAVSWIPSEAIEGITKLPFEMGIGHYDAPPPDRLTSLDALYDAGAFRFANELHAWIDVEDGRVVGYGQEGRSLLSKTRMKLGPIPITFAPTPFPELTPDPQVTADGSVRFEQTAGGRPGMPAPRKVRGGFVHIVPPTVWTTLSLTIAPDGTSTGELVGASTFPRHWVYDDTGQLVAKSGLIDFSEWYEAAYGTHTPWGDEQTPALSAAAETALERELSATIMRGGRSPGRRRLAPGDVLVEQGQEGDELYLVLDGVLEVIVDGEKLAEIGPGALVGERAILEGGRRTATLRAVTECRLAVAGPDEIDHAALAELAQGHRREEQVGDS